MRYPALRHCSALPGLSRAVSSLLSLWRPAGAGIASFGYTRASSGTTLTSCPGTLRAQGLRRSAVSELARLLPSLLALAPFGRRDCVVRQYPSLLGYCPHSLSLDQSIGDRHNLLTLVLCRPRRLARIYLRRPIVPCGRKRKRKKSATHKRKKKLRKNRHKNK